MPDRNHSNGLWYAHYEWVSGFLVYFEICKEWNLKVESANFA